MARYTGPVCRLCRRETAASKTGEKIKLFLKGDRCMTKKCAVERRGTAPGQKTLGKGKGRQKISEYGRQLREKQKMRRYYGVVERQFENYFREASRKKGTTGTQFLQMLEQRLDNVVYRLNLAGSRAQARQLVTHRHFTVNGRKVNVPSFLVRPGDMVGVAEASQKSSLFQMLLDAAANRHAPAWLSYNEQEKVAKIERLPGREEIDTPVDEQLIVEYYSR
ncbi:MAG TPA: 30S ribosomal protein S4 [Candidatus Dormibacteraeota bacterium]|nr:30S ribosomal protein S4 [Candidatus Dormibacteraeota bacterium]